MKENVGKMYTLYLSEVTSLVPINLDTLHSHSLKNTRKKRHKFIKQHKELLKYELLHFISSHRRDLAPLHSKLFCTNSSTVTLLLQCQGINLFVQCPRFQNGDTTSYRTNDTSLARGAACCGAKVLASLSFFIQLIHSSTVAPPLSDKTSYSLFLKL